MLYRSLARGKFKVSCLSVGSALFGMNYGFHKVKTQREVDEILEGCLRLGVNLIDTARDYADSEEKIGHFIHQHPSCDLIIATKISRIDRETAKTFSGLKNHILNSVKTSLKYLGVDRIPILQLHQDEDFVVFNDYLWQVMESLRKERLIDSFGVSVYDVQLTQKILKQYSLNIDFVQIPYNVFDQRFEVLFPFLKEKSIDVLARSVFLKGVISTNEEDLPTELQRIKPFKKKLHALALKMNLSDISLALLFVVGCPSVSSTLAGVGSIEELQENVKILKEIDRWKEMHPDVKELAVSDTFLIDPRGWRGL